MMEVIDLPLALESLEALRVLTKDNEKSNFFLADSSRAKVNLVISLFKLPPIPPNGKPSPITIKLPIPHSFVDEQTDVLLITKDLKGHKGLKKDHLPTYHHFKNLLSSHNASGLVKEVMPLKQLKTEFKDYESKRNLANRFDIVLCDDTVIRMVPHFLGKAFYSKRKYPIQVNLKAKHLETEIERVLSKTYLHLNMIGTSSMVQIGRADQPNSELAENLLAIVGVIKEKILGGSENLQALFLKTDESKAVPLYANLGPRDGVENLKPPAEPKYEIGEFSLLEDALVKITNCDVQVIRAGGQKRTRTGLQKTKRALRNRKKPKLLENKRPKILRKKKSEDLLKKKSKVLEKIPSKILGKSKSKLKIKNVEELSPKKKPKVLKKKIPKVLENMHSKALTRAKPKLLNKKKKLKELAEKNDLEKTPPLQTKMQMNQNMLKNKMRREMKTKIPRGLPEENPLIINQGETSKALKVKRLSKSPSSGRPLLRHRFSDASLPVERKKSKRSSIKELLKIPLEKVSPKAMRSKKSESSLNEKKTGTKSLLKRRVLRAAGKVANKNKRVLITKL